MVSPLSTKMEFGLRAGLLTRVEVRSRPMVLSGPICNIVAEDVGVYVGGLDSAKVTWSPRTAARSRPQRSCGPRGVVARATCDFERDTP